MPVQCDQSVLTGADGLVTFSPAGTHACLAEADITASGLNVGVDKRFKVGDPVTLEYPTGAAKEDSTVGAGDYFVQAFDTSTGILQVSSTKGGAAVAPTGDGSFDAAGHAELTYTGTEAICSVTEWSLDLSKDTADVTTLPCSISAAGKVAPVRKTQGTFLNGEGSMTMLFTADMASNSNRLLTDAIMADSTVYAKLYISAVAGAGNTVDDTKSMYYAGKVNLQGFSISVNTTDAIQAEVSFSVADTPDALFGVIL